MIRFIGKHLGCVVIPAKNCVDGKSVKLTPADYKKTFGNFKNEDALVEKFPLAFEKVKDEPKPEPKQEQEAAPVSKGKK